MPWHIDMFELHNIWEKSHGSSIPGTIAHGHQLPQNPTWPCKIKVSTLADQQLCHIAYVGSPPLGRRVWGWASISPPGFRAREHNYACIYLCLFENYWLEVIVKGRKVTLLKSKWTSDLGWIRFPAMFKGVEMDTYSKLDKLTTLECYSEPFWRHNEIILNKGYFQHKVLTRSNTCRLLQVSEEAEWKAMLMKHC